MWLKKDRKKLESKLKELHVLVARTKHANEIIMGDKATCHFELNDISCLYKGISDGYCSMGFSAAVDFRYADADEIPFHRWRSLTEFEYEQIKDMVDVELIVFDSSSLQAMVHSSIHDLFANYRLDEVQEFTTCDLLNMVKLQLSDYAGFLHLLEVSGLRFSSLSWETNTLRKKELENCSMTIELRWNWNERLIKLSDTGKNLN